MRAGWWAFTRSAGMAGVGKTAFAVHAAHKLADRFPNLVRCRATISGSGAAALEPFSDPELDDGLPGNPQSAGFPV